jgi:hypothetical protein
MSNTGLGTITPQGRLDVRGTAYIGNNNASTQVVIQDKEVKFQGTLTSHYSIFNSNGLLSFNNTSANIAQGVYGTYMMGLNSLGYLGINTTGPLANLHIASTNAYTQIIDAVDTSTGTAIVIYQNYGGSTNSNLIFGVAGTTKMWSSDSIKGDAIIATNHNRLIFNTNYAGTSTMCMLSNRYIGLSTSSPNLPLSMTTPINTSTTSYNLVTYITGTGGGIGNFTGTQMTAGDNGTQSLLLYAGGSYPNGAGIIQSKDVLSSRNYGQKLLLNPDGGNVGINTNSPGYSLDVNGIAYIRSNLYVGTPNAQNSIFFGGQPNDFDSLGKPYSAIISRNYDPAGGTVATSDYSEILIVQMNDPGPTSGPDRIRHLAAAHKFQVYNAAITPADTNTFYADNSYTTAMYINPTGQVGIGTSNQNAPLQLANTLANRKLVLYDIFNDDHRYYGFGVQSGILRYQVDSTASAHIFYAATSSTASSELMRLTGAGTLGIGTASPNAIYKLDVNGAILTNNNNIYAGSGTITAGTVVPVTNVSYNLGATNYFWNNSYIVNGIFYTGVTIGNTTTANAPSQGLSVVGSVGIGTGSPGAKLHVTGDVLANSIYPITTNAYSLGSGTNIFNTAYIKTGYIYSQLGIGTTTPTSKLDVIASSYGGAPESGGIYCYNSTAGQSNSIAVRTNGSGSPFYSMDILGVNGWSMGIDNSDGNKMKFKNSWNFVGTDIMTFSSTSVGIGTASPNASYKLDVAGDINTSTTMRSVTLSNSGNMQVGGFGNIHSTTYIGQGYYGSAWATFGHLNTTVNVGGYALMQNSSGDTLINCVSGRSTEFRLNNGTYGSYSASGWSFNSSITTNNNNITAGSGTITAATFSGNLAGNTFFTGAVGGNNNSIIAGTGDGGSIATYNVAFKSYWGIGFPSYDGVNRITFDTRNGNISSSGTIYAALTGNVTGNCSGSSGSCTGNAASSSLLNGGNSLQQNSWFASQDGHQRLYFGSTSTTYYNAPNGAHHFRYGNGDSGYGGNLYCATVTAGNFYGYLNGSISGNANYANSAGSAGSAGGLTGNPDISVSSVILPSPTACYISPYIYVNGAKQNYGYGDAASYTANNLNIQSWQGIGFPTYDGTNRIFFDCRSGNICTNGKIGIGTDSPGYKLDVSGDINFTGELRKNGSVYGGGSSTVSGDISVTNVIVSQKIGIGTASPLGPLHITASGNSATANGIYCNNPTNSANQDAVMSLRVGGGLAGNPYIGLDIANVAGWSLGVDNGDSDKFKICTQWAFPGSPVMTIERNGNLFVQDMFATSDIRKKKNFEPIINSLEIVNKLKGTYFKMINDNNDKRKIGLIAQEVLQVLPEVVIEDSEGFLSISYSPLVALLIETTKEQMKEINVLKEQMQEINVLKEQMKEVMEKLNK